MWESRCCPWLPVPRKKPETEPEVTVQAAKAEKQSIRQVIRSEAVLYPKNQAAITPKIVAPVKVFYVNRGSHVQAGQLLAVLENRDLAAAETDTKGSYQQAEANYGIETASALPEEWQKAEYDLKAAKENYDAEQKIYDSRKNLYRGGRAAAQRLRPVSRRVDPSQVAVRNRIDAHDGTASRRQETATRIGRRDSSPRRRVSTKARRRSSPTPKCAALSMGWSLTARLTRVKRLRRERRC